MYPPPKFKSDQSIQRILYWSRVAAKVPLILLLTLIVMLGLAVLSIEFFPARDAGWGDIIFGGYLILNISLDVGAHYYRKKAEEYQPADLRAVHQLSEALYEDPDIVEHMQYIFFRRGYLTMQEYHYFVHLLRVGAFTDLWKTQPSLRHSSLDKDYLS